MVKEVPIPGVTTINGKVYLSIRRFDIFLTMIIGAGITAIGGILTLQKPVGAFFFGVGLTACLLSIEQLGNAMVGYKKIKPKASNS